MHGYRQYQGEQKRGDLLNGHSHDPGSWEASDRSLKARRSLKSFLGREAECYQGRIRSRKGDRGHDPRQGAWKGGEGEWTRFPCLVLRSF